MAKRIVRAKNKIRDARIPFRVPGRDELPQRLPGVLQVVYSIFTEGYAASSGPQLQRLDLAEEAIRLARILRRLLPAEREVDRAAGADAAHPRPPRRPHRPRRRTGPPRRPGPRAAGTGTMIEEGRALVPVALTGGPPGPYGVQAAIAALHDEAADVAEHRLAADRRPLRRAAGAHPVAGRRAEPGRRGGDARRPGGGPRAARRAGRRATAARLPPVPVARADLLPGSAGTTEAAAAYRQAIELAGTEPERAHLHTRLQALY